MNIIWLQLASLVYIVFLNIIYFSKNRLSTLENNVYKKLLVLNVLGLLIELCCFYSVSHMDTMPFFNAFVTRLLLVYYFGFIMLYTYYVFIVAHNTDDADKKKLTSFLAKVRNICFIVFAINSIIMSFLPLEYYKGENYVYSYGTAVNYLVVSLAVVIGVWLIVLFKHFKNIKVKKYLPIITFIVLAGIGGVVQSIYPQLLLTTPIETFIIFLMFFTIENPDMKMINELLENRKIIERANEEKSVFLFKASQGLKEPVNNIDKQIELFNQVKENTSEDVGNIIENIDANNKKIRYLINEVIGINSFDINNIKKSKNTYNIYSLLENIKARGNALVKNGVDYKFEVVENIPKELYGDGIRLKQVLISILTNCLNTTKQGFVLVDVNSFTRYDICRLVISIKYSDENIDVQDINNILNQDAEITEQESYRLEKSDIDLSLAYKVVKSLGGTMYIKSEKDKGVEITITIDQYIVENEEIKNNSNVDSYIKSRRNIKRVLVVDDEEEEIRKIKKILESRGYDIVTSMYGKDAVDRIRNKEKYDIILIDDEMPLMNGINVLQEMNKLKDKSKKIVLLGRDKLFIAKHYIEDGFDDFIDKEKLIKEIEEKIK